MAENLPEPKSRKESYLAKAAGMDVSIPEEPESRLEQYLEAIAENGGGGGGGTSNFNKLTNRPKYNGTTMTGTTDIPQVVNTAFTGTDGTAAGTAGLVPAPATTDAGKFLKADGTWDTAGGGGDSVYSTVTTSNSSTGGAVYIGNLNANQEEQPDPTTDDSHRKYFWALPYTNDIQPSSGSVNILGQQAGDVSVAIGSNAICRLGSQIAIGASAINNYSADYGTAIGYGAQCLSANSVALGSKAKTTRVGEVNVGTGTSGTGYNSTNYRVIGGVHDGQTDHDAATVGQLNGRVLQNAGAPTTATVGTVGQLLEDTTNGKLYQCTAVDTTDPNAPVYTWTEVGAGGGGSGPTVVQTTGTSTTDVMSQNAASSMVFANPGTDTKVQIGSGAAATGNSSVSIGQDSKAEATSATAVGRNTDAKSQSSTAVGFYSKAMGEGSVAVGEQTVAGGSTSALRTLAIGSNASAGLKGSVAVGAYSYAASVGEMNIGAHNQTGYGYNNTQYRLLSGLYDGQNAHDAVTVEQVNATIDAINTALSTSIPHIGA